MPRRPRTEVPGGLHHVTAKTMPGRDLFVDDADRRSYLDGIGRIVGDRRWQVLAYCLMTNHVHLLLRTPAPDLGQGMKEAHEMHAMRMNRRHDAAGHVFRDRFKNALVTTESHAVGCLRYIARNPVKARMRRRAADWPWSSHGALAGESTPPDFLDVEAALGLYGDDLLAARRSYVRAVAMSDDNLVRERFDPRPGPWLVELVDAYGVPVETIARVLGWHSSTAYRKLAEARAATEGTVPSVAR